MLIIFVITYFRFDMQYYWSNIFIITDHYVTSVISYVINLYFILKWALGFV